jgi:iron complex outermembrane receptor protein
MQENQLIGIGSLTALCSLAVASGALAQDNEGNVLEEIVVTATRIEQSIDEVPAAISVVTQDDIQLARQQLALDESLSRVPGVFMQNRYNFAQDLRISIRGFGARANFGIRGIKILVDGIPETLPDGQGSVDGIDIGATSQIEVLRGPSSSIYGNASGGVISVITEPPPMEKTAQVRLSAGEYGFRKVQAKFGGQGDRVGYMLSVSDSEIDGYREQSRAENTQFTGRFNVDLGDERELLAVLNYTDQPTSDDPGGINAAQAASDPRSARDLNLLYDAGEFLEQSRIGFVYSMPLGDKHELTARNYYVWRDFGNSLPFFGGGQVDLDRFFSGGGFTYSYNGALGGKDNKLIVGVDYDHQDDDRLRYDNDNGVRGSLTFDQNETVDSKGFYVQDVLSLSETVDLNLGLRYDEVEFDVTDRFLSDGNDSGVRSLDDVSPMAGISVALSDRLHLYGTYSSAFETPTTTEFANPSGGGGFNGGLDPQTARNLEVGLRGTFNDRNRFDLALFDIKVDDELVPYELADFPGRDFFRNAATSSRQGIELSLVSQPTDTIRTTVSYTHSNFEFDDFPVYDDANNVVNNYAGNTIPGTAESVFFGEINYLHPRGWFVSWDVLYIGEQYANNTNSALVDDYTVSNLRLGMDYDLGSITLSPFIGVNNLFDESYFSNIRINAFGGRFYEPAPERNAFAGVTLNFTFD